jgi:hypothetical protein
MYEDEAVVSDPFIQRVARSLLDDIDVLTDEMVRRIVIGDRFYEQAAAGLPEKIRGDIEQNLRQVLRGLAGMEPLDFGMTRDLAKDRAELGVPVAELLHAYRVCAQVIWDHHLAAAHRLGMNEFDLDQILDGASQLWTLTNTYCSVVSQAYDDTASDRARRSERERMLVLDALFEGRIHDLPVRSDTARLLDLPEREPFVVIVAEARTPGEESLTRIDQALRRTGLRSSWRLKTQRQMGVVVIGTASGALARVREIVAERATGRVGISPVFHDLLETSRHVGLADLAMSCVPPGDKGVALFDEHPVGALVVRSPELSERIARSLLGPLLALEDDERDTLLGTLRTYFQEAGSTAQTAERLFCHRNTVRNRLQRIESLTDRSLTDPAAVTELGIALTALTLTALPLDGRVGA